MTSRDLMNRMFAEMNRRKEDKEDPTPSYSPPYIQMIQESMAKRGKLRKFEGTAEGIISGKVEKGIMEGKFYGTFEGTAT